MSLISTSRALTTIVILSGAISWTGGAQEAKGASEFEVASIKPAPPRIPFSAALGLLHFRNDGAVFDASNQTLTSLISFAYGIQFERISGPGWMSEQEFAIAAKLPAGARKEEVPAMLQKLLAERFKLSLHRDQRVEPVYELVVDQKGAILKPSASDVPEKQRGSSGRPGQGLCRACTIGQLAVFLSGSARSRMEAMAQPDDLTEHRIDRVVVDRTGLTGRYAIDLEWIPPGGLPRGHDFGNFPPRDPAAKANSIFGALEAVGLKLQSAKHAFDILVVDHAERVPSEN